MIFAFSLACCDFHQFNLLMNSTTDKQNPVKLSLTGQISHVIEDKGNCSLVISVDPFYLTIRDHGEVHLGDKVTMDVDLRIVNLQQEFSTSDS
jgi:hypothetical protein